MSLEDTCSRRRSSGRTSFSILVLALHTSYIAALILRLMGTQGLMWLALAAYVSYAVNATQFFLKFRAARLDVRSGESFASAEPETAS